MTEDKLHFLKYCPIKLNSQSHRTIFSKMKSFFYVGKKLVATILSQNTRGAQKKKTFILINVNKYTMISYN